MIFGGWDIVWGLRFKIIPFESSILFLNYYFLFVFQNFMELGYMNMIRNIRID